MDEQLSPSERIKRRLHVQHTRWQLSQPNFPTYWQKQCRIGLRKLRRGTIPIWKAIDSVLDSTLGAILTIAIILSGATWLWSQRSIAHQGVEAPNLLSTIDLNIWFTKWSLVLLWLSGVFLIASTQWLHCRTKFATSPSRPWQTGYLPYLFAIPVILINASLLAVHANSAWTWLLSLPFNILMTLLSCRLIGGIGIWIAQFANQTYFLMATKRKKVPIQKILFAFAIGIFPLVLLWEPLNVDRFLPSAAIIFPTGTMLTLLVGVVNGNWISIIALLTLSTALYFGGNYIRRLVKPYKVRRQIVTRSRVIEFKEDSTASGRPLKPKFESVDRDAIEALVQKRLDHDCEPVVIRLTRNLWNDFVSYPLGNLIPLVFICSHIGLTSILNSVELPPTEIESFEPIRQGILFIFTLIYVVCFEFKFLFRRIFVNPTDLTSRPISEFQAWKSYQFEGLSVSICSSLLIATIFNGQGLQVQSFAVLSVFAGQLAFRNLIAALAVIYAEASLRPKWFVELWITLLILPFGVFVLMAHQIHALVHLGQFKLLLFHTALPLSLALFGLSVWWRSGVRPCTTNWHGSVAVE